MGKEQFYSPGCETWATEGLAPQLQVGVGILEDLSQLGCSWRVLACRMSWEEPWMDSGTTMVSCVALGRSLSLSELQLPNAQMGREIPSCHSGLLSEDLLIST